MKDKPRIDMIKINLADNTIVTEDEKKFQDYFLDEKNRKAERLTIMKHLLNNSQNHNIELQLNRELIEQHQETIIEHEEQIPAYPISDEKFITLGKKRRQIFPVNNFKARIKDELLSLQNIKIGSWVQAGKAIVGLKGGADNNRPGPSTSRESKVII